MSQYCLTYENIYSSSPHEAQTAALSTGRGSRWALPCPSGGVWLRLWASFPPGPGGHLQQRCVTGSEASAGRRTTDQRPGDGDCTALNLSHWLQGPLRPHVMTPTPGLRCILYPHHDRVSYHIDVSLTQANNYNVMRLIPKVIGKYYDGKPMKAPRSTVFECSELHWITIINNHI